MTVRRALAIERNEVLTHLSCAFAARWVESRTSALTLGCEELLFPATFACGGASVPALAPFPVPARQTGRAVFPHPAFRPASAVSCRGRPPQLHPAQAHYAPLAKHNLVGISTPASRLHLVPPPQKSSHPLVDIVVHRAVGLRARPLANLHFSPPDGESTRWPRHYFVALGRECSTDCQVRLRAPTVARLVLTHLSRTFARHVVRNAG